MALKYAFMLQKTAKNDLKKQWIIRLSASKFIREELIKEKSVYALKNDKIWP